MPVGFQNSVSIREFTPSSSASSSSRSSKTPPSIRAKRTTLTKELKQVIGMIGNYAMGTIDEDAFDTVTSTKQAFFAVARYIIRTTFQVMMDHQLDRVQTILGLPSLTKKDLVPLRARAMQDLLGSAPANTIQNISRETTIVQRQRTIKNMIVGVQEMLLDLLVTDLMAMVP